jgi:single-strand DNA-binding protein
MARGRPCLRTIPVDVRRGDIRLMSYEMKGTVKRLFDVWKSDTSEFYKREFVITTAEQYPSDVKFSALKEKSDQLSNIKEGDQVMVKFDVRGREYNDRYYVDLNAWRVEKMGAEAPAGAPMGEAEPAAAGIPPAPEFNPSAPASSDDDLPF